MLEKSEASTEAAPLRFHSSFECGNLLSARLLRWSGGAPGLPPPPTCAAGVPATHPVTKHADRAGAAAAGAAKDSGATPTGACTTAVQAPAPAALQAADGDTFAEASEGALEYELVLVADTQSTQTQWFYFGVDTLNFIGIVHFRIVNMQKNKSLYQQGRQPYVYSNLCHGRGWEPSACEQVSYMPNSSGGRARGGDALADRATLSFSYRIAHRGDQLYFASYPPYSYTMLARFIQHLTDDQETCRNFRCVELCRSIGELPVPLLVVSHDARQKPRGPAPSRTSRPPSQGPAGKRGSVAAKPAVVVIARQHPGEVVGSWAVQGLLRFLLGPTPCARELREQYEFHVVPMVNVDGVVHGNSRCNLAGIDPNRVWAEPNPITHPEVHAVKRHLQNLADGAHSFVDSGRLCSGIELFLDMHGHSVAFGCFFYGSCRNSHISAALFPKLCAMATRDVSFEKCHWRCPKSHRGTARYVVYKQLAVKDSFTMECSLFAPAHAAASWRAAAEGDAGAQARVSPSASTPPASASDIFTPSRVEWIGCAVGCASAVFLRRCGALVSSDAVDALPPSVCEEHAASAGTGDAQSEAMQGDRAETCSARLTGALWEDILLGSPPAPDAPSAAALAPRPWLTIQRLEGANVSQVLDALTAAHGHRVPDPKRARADDGCSDGDDDEADGPDSHEEAIDSAATEKGASVGSRSSKGFALASPASRRKRARGRSRGLAASTAKAPPNLPEALPSPRLTCRGESAPVAQMSPRSAAQQWFDSDQAVEGFAGKPPTELSSAVWKPASADQPRKSRPCGVMEVLPMAPGMPLPPPMPPGGAKPVQITSSLAAMRFAHTVASSRCSSVPRNGPCSGSTSRDPSADCASASRIVGPTSIHGQRGAAGVPSTPEGEGQWAMCTAPAFDGAVVGRCISSGSSCTAGSTPAVTALLARTHRHRSCDTAQQPHPSPDISRRRQSASAREGRAGPLPQQPGLEAVSAREPSRGPPRLPGPGASPRPVERQLLPSMPRACARGARAGAPGAECRGIKPR